MKTILALTAFSVGAALSLSSAKLAAEGQLLNRVLVKYDNEGSGAKGGGSHEDVVGVIHKAVSADGGKIHHEFSDLRAMAVSLSAHAIESLRKDPRVKYIENDPVVVPLGQVLPYGVAMVQAPQAWTSGYLGSGAFVCVIDSGVDASHEDFAGINFVGGYPADWNSDGCGHGTHVTGTILARDNVAGVVGVAPGLVDVFVVKVFDHQCRWTYSSTVVDAANRCKSAADAAGKPLIVNMSLGGGSPSTTSRDGFQRLYDQGVLLVAAAGNGGNTGPLYPASYSSVMSVAAVDANKRVARFSQINNQVEIAAPGVSVQSTVAGGYALYSGTSMAAPHVSGAGALLWSAHPQACNADVRAALTATAEDLGVPGRDTSYGHGLVQVADAIAGLSPGQGCEGRIDRISPSSINDGFQWRVADFDGDGRSDLYFWNVSSGTNRLFLSRGDGSFTYYSNPIGVGFVNDGFTWSIGDFNGDGRSDVYFWNGVTGTNRLFLSNGAGTFSRYLDPIPVGAINDGFQWMVADFNGDGRDDAYFWNGTTGTNRLFLSNGNATFVYYSNPISVGSINDGFVWNVGDFNGDGRADVYFWNRTVGTNRLFLGGESGTFVRQPEPISPGAINDGFQWTVGDFSGDGFDDVYFWNATSGTNRLFLSNGDGSFTYISNPINPGSINDQFVWKAADFNGDGRQDVYFWARTSGVNRLFTSLGNGSFAYLKNPIAIDFIDNGDAWEAGDFFGDGSSDIFFWWRSSGANRLFEFSGRGLLDLQSEADGVFRGGFEDIYLFEVE